MRRLREFACALAVLAALTPVLTAAQTVAADWPSRPIRIVVAQAPGGPPDRIARFVAEPLSRVLGVPVTVENRPGASGVIGADHAMRAAPDGYTLLIATLSTHVLVPATAERPPYDAVRVLLVGQDPYHDDDQAHGLCFSVRRGIKLPPSLRNIYKELESDLDLEMPKHGFLQPWADRGVLMLNTVLTVRAHEANSHRKKGWETFTDRVIALVAEREQPVVFVLWGKPAQAKLKIIDKLGGGRHAVVQAAHPSPLSANAGFFGSKCFSQINAALVGFGQPAIDWSLPE